jgi:hypothetical protein
VHRRIRLIHVIAGLDPAIHAQAALKLGEWMPGSGHDNENLLSASVH